MAESPESGTPDAAGPDLHPMAVFPEVAAAKPMSDSDSIQSRMGDEERR